MPRTNVRGVFCIDVILNGEAEKDPVQKPLQSPWPLILTMPCHPGPLFSPRLVTPATVLFDYLGLQSLRSHDPRMGTGSAYAISIANRVAALRI